MLGDSHAFSGYLLKSSDMKVICAHSRQKSDLLLGVWIHNGSNGLPQGIEYPVFIKDNRHAVGNDSFARQWLVLFRTDT
jgi:hypothetical protein